MIAGDNNKEKQDLTQRFIEEPITYEQVIAAPTASESCCRIVFFATIIFCFFPLLFILLAMVILFGCCHLCYYRDFPDEKIRYGTNKLGKRFFKYQRLLIALLTFSFASTTENIEHEIYFARRTKNKVKEASSLYLLGKANEEKYLLDEALQNYAASIELFQRVFANLHHTSMQNSSKPSNLQYDDDDAATEHYILSYIGIIIIRFQFLKQSSDALELAKEALSLALKNEWYKHVVMVANVACSICKEQGQSKQALEFAKQMYQASIKYGKDAKQQYEASTEVGALCYQLDQYDDAIAALHKSLEYAEKLQDAAKVVETRLNLSKASMLAKQFDDSVMHVQVGLQFAQVKMEHHLPATVTLLLQLYSCLGNAYACKEDFAKSVEAFTQVLALSEQAQSIPWKCKALYKIGMFEKRLQRATHAMQHLQQAAEFMQQLSESERPNDVLLSEIFQTLAVLYQSAGKVQMASTCIQHVKDAKKHEQASTTTNIAISKPLRGASQSIKYREQLRTAVALQQKKQQQSDDVAIVIEEVQATPQKNATFLPTVTIWEQSPQKK